jgi:hypothetical protein
MCKLLLHIYEYVFVFDPGWPLGRVVGGSVRLNPASTRNSYNHS